ncbi:type IV-A pilus assembly ATPase PilB [Gammaproteobacteria bacterium LSUCC0057]|uniref:Type IV-A pilus assembly ATPase PilB n=1 Tax=Gammaproteobacteria bacterium LSUCC0057 TaxID=2559237 RepID=A0A4Y8UJR3_9GAMM|nr:type IV-A pilus assembly ATPase PilB [Gammaproteobacteria bacterium LSUCC0057]
MNTAAPQLHGLPLRLVNEHQLDEAEALALLAQASAEKRSPIVLLYSSGLLDAAQIADSAAREFGLPLYDLSVHQLDAVPRQLVDAKLLRKHCALPLYKRGNRLFIAIADPTNYQAIAEIQFQTGSSVEAVLCRLDQLEPLLDSYLDNPAERALEDSLGTIDEIHLDEIDIEMGEREQEIDSSTGQDDAPVVRFVNKMMLDAIRLGASDIHFEPYEKHYRIRFRIDGVLQEISRPPVNLAPRLAARLKVMSRMDISERRIPQDGRIKLKLSKNRAIDFRVNSLPLQFGEKVVLRILDPAAAQMGLDALGFEAEQRLLYEQALARPQGMILVTGPTGSGKTVTLYTGLNALNSDERNISTAEDPVEINIEGVNQVQINLKVGLTFAEALRSFLRQDPDVVMVGEIRDLETAEISIKAAQTGHLVLSTLHTNSATETLTRLLNMGVATFNVATSVSLIIAQRLARKLCENCKVPLAELPPAIVAEQGLDQLEIDVAAMTLFTAAGCDQCRDGYRGRIGIYETLAVTEQLAEVIMQGASSIETLAAAKAEGFKTLRHNALRKVAAGLISLEEANRVTRQ